MPRHAPASLDTGATATDELIDLEENNEDDETPGYTRHVEPEEQGGEEFVRCEGCGRELLVKLGGEENLAHADGCPNGRGRDE